MRPSLYLPVSSGNRSPIYWWEVASFLFLLQRVCSKCRFNSRVNFLLFPEGYPFSSWFEEFAYLFMLQKADKDFVYLWKRTLYFFFFYGLPRLFVSIFCLWRSPSDFQHSSVFSTKSSFYFTRVKSKQLCTEFSRAPSLKGILHCVRLCRHIGSSYFRLISAWFLQTASVSWPLMQAVFEVFAGSILV